MGEAACVVVAGCAGVECTHAVAGGAEGGALLYAGVLSLAGAVVVRVKGPVGVAAVWGAG